MSSDLPYMPLYIRDYEGDTAHLSIEEDGAYNRLLRLCWRTPGCSIPDDATWIRRKMRVDEATYDRVVAPILEEFFTVSRGRWSQKKQIGIYNDKKSVVEKAKEASKKAVLAKQLKNNKTTPTERLTERTPDGKPDGEPDGQPIQNQNQNQKIPVTDVTDEDVEMSVTDKLWKKGVPYLINRGISESSARSEIGKLLSKSGHSPPVIYEAFKAAQDAKTQDPVPYIEAYLANRREGVIEQFKRCLWDPYPETEHKVDELKAQLLFARIVQGKHPDIPQVDGNTIRRGVLAMAKSKPDPQYIPSPTTFLSGQRWKVHHLPADRSPEDQADLDRRLAEADEILARYDRGET